MKLLGNEISCIIPMPEPFLRACPWPGVFPQSYLGIVGQGGIFIFMSCGTKAENGNHKLQLLESTVRHSSYNHWFVWGGMVTNFTFQGFYDICLDPRVPLSQQFRGSINNGSSRIWFQFRIFSKNALMSPCRLEVWSWSDSTKKKHRSPTPNGATPIPMS